MAEEPKNPMDQILRAYSEARKKGAHLPLHPATRKMLHAEVARRFKNAAPQPFWVRLRSFWPQIAFGAGLCTILMIAVISLRHHPEAEKDARAEQQKAAPSAPMLEDRGRTVLDEPAKQESAQRDAAEVALQKHPANQPESSDAFRLQPGYPELLKRSLPEAKAPTQEAERLVKAANVFAPDAQTAVNEQEQVSKAKDDSLGLRQLREQSAASRSATPLAQTVAPKTAQLKAAASPPAENVVAGPSQSAPKPVKLVRASELTNLGDALRLRFVQLPTAGNRQANPPVLTSFQVERAGDDLRFVDRDNSVYSGQLFPEPPGQNARSFGAAPVQLGLAEQNSAVYLFHAQGTNITLAKPVTVEGRYLERTNQTVLMGTATNILGRATGSTAGRARSAIIGKAIVARTNEFPVTAVSVEPQN